jgi:penicillin-binding protein 2
MSVIHAPKQPSLDGRILLFPLMMLAFLSAIFLRLWYVQVVKAPELRERAKEGRDRRFTAPAPRGLVFDRHGSLVAGVRSELVVTGVQKELDGNPDVLPRVAEILQTDPNRLQNKLNEAFGRRYMPTPIFTGATLHQGAVLAEPGAALPGIGIVSQPVRFYPDTRNFSHVMGYVWVPDKGDTERLREQGVEVPVYVGKQGIERAYDLELMGEMGAERYESDARGRLVGIAGRDAPVPGKQLFLTIDADLQRFAQQVLSQRQQPGAVVAIEPATGEVLAMASTPTFDLDLFRGGISQKEWDALTLDPRKPMLNRCIQTALAPGSTFKIVTAIAAAQHLGITPRTAVTCNGGYAIGRKVVRCMGRHGTVGFERAMEKSCNTYFSSLGHRVGRENLLATAQKLGLGDRIGIEIGGEVRGYVPDERWLNRTRKPAVWYGGDVVNASLGQGPVSATPLQMAQVACFVANSGVAYRPHLVRAVQSREEATPRRVEPVEQARVELSDAFWASLQRSLVRVIQSGTARSAQIANITWAGKTGSAEHAKAAKTHGWFVGYAPAENPKIAIAVMVEAAGHGGEVAAPVAKAVVERYLSASAKREVASASGRPRLASRSSTP